MRTHTGVLIVSAALLIACGPDLRFEADPSVPIPDGASWAWSAPDDDGLAPHDGALQPTDSVARFIVAAVESELASRGYARVPAESAAFIVHYHVGRRSVTDTLLPRPDVGIRGDDGQRAPGAWGGHGVPEDIADRAVTWQEGMLILDVLPRDRRTVAWRGVIAGEIPTRAERHPQPAIRAAVARLLRDFPRS